MPIELNSNLPSPLTNRQIYQRKDDLDRSLERISSGKRINRAADDPAGLAIALSVMGDAENARVAARNISDGVSVVSIAQGALDTASEITTRMAELASAASNGSLSDEERSALNEEYQALRSELDRISQSTEFNGLSLLAANSTITIQAGISGGSQSEVTISLPAVNAAALGLTTDISTQANARGALDELQGATAALAESRDNIGASVTRLSNVFENLKTSEVKGRESGGRILDADMADEVARLTASRIGLDVSLSVQAQANQQSQLVMRLLS